MPEQSTTLRDMIEAARDRGATYRDLAARAIDPETGEKASYGLINNIVLGKNGHAPEPKHLRAIAAALQVPYERVRQGAIAQWLPADADTGAADLAVPGREQLRAEALRLRKIADETLARIEREAARADRETGRVDRETGGGAGARPKSA